ncbi:unnamed protein product [Blepharisma stoltei]|uniref:Odorant receptor n=1 Tax=Blepharisma stoltei TaxID=1481888 RepID=A0AAU9K902_9CILI|nr:unnamed protein product [Blepharisma stoltei]
MSNSRAQIYPSPKEPESETFWLSSRNSQFLDNRNSSGLTLLRKLKTHDEDAQYEFSYHWNQFAIALSIHLIHILLGPLSLPILHKVFGSSLCINMAFARTVTYLVEFTTFTCTAMTVIFCIYYQELAYQWIGLIVSSLAIIFLKTALISIKYGYYSEKKWKHLNKGIIDTKEIRSEFLILSWLHIPEEVLDTEIHMSLRRQSKNASELCFLFEAPLEDSCHKAFTDLKIKLGIEINHENNSHEDGNQCYPFIVFARQLIQKADSRAHISREGKLILLSAIIYASLPFITKYWIYGNFSGDMNGLLIAIAVLNTIETIFEGWRFLMFIYVGVVDFKRKRTLIDECTALISDLDIKGTSVFDHNIPNADMYDLRTIDAWYTLRVVFLDFGRKYTYRIFAYSSLVFPLTFVMIALFLLQTGGVLGGASNGALISLLFLTVICLILIIYMIFSGIALNQAFSVHRDLVLNIIGHIMKNNDYKDPNSDCKASVKLLQFVVQKIEQDEILRPVKIMGIKLDSIMLAKIATILLSSLLAMTQMYFKNKI